MTTSSESGSFRIICIPGERDLRVSKSLSERESRGRKGEECHACGVEASETRQKARLALGC